MKKIIYLLLFSLLLASCGGGKENDVFTETISPGNRAIQTVEFEGCEYVYLRRYGSVTLTHKGNCKHCVELKYK